jgi:hypothetical protein
MILGLKGCMSSDKFVDHDSSWPYIYFFCVATSTEHFWGAVVESTSDGEHLKFGASPSVFSAYSIVYKFKSFTIWIIKDIFRFDISVADCSLMQIM